MAASKRCLHHPLGNYVLVAILAAEAGYLQPGDVGLSNCYHDDWCSLLAGDGACDCEVEVEHVKLVDGRLVRNRN